MNTLPVTLPMWVIEQIREGMKLTPGTWTELEACVDRAVEQSAEQRSEPQIKLEAARYRLLRKGGMLAITRLGATPEECRILTEEDADAAIDAEMG
ncbi:hypothetical protein NJC38_02525 [Pseudomonas sp. 21LCFQ010]|uniref:hypothetical protein n=1 Tax=Pseudomonas sp. 21LCFQ010 TaxID=2957506 RepID=UPI00209741CA|nr:hypothetical protein [Pseudomonas sp. 21LCFQ010]MCO8161025.1 hypothetical protein [Pseudomonas sp. 21LCFQ010]